MADNGNNDKNESKNPVSGIIDAVAKVISGGSDSAGSDKEVEAAQVENPENAPSKLPQYLQARRTEVGRVVSDKMEKSVVVSVERSKQHPIYKKVMRRSVKFMAHDELGAVAGDLVRIVESRPMSKRKRWQVIEIVQRAVKL
jgi:small subunit ribosomal protein S17